MTLPAPTYDLLLLLDPQADEQVRAKQLADVGAAISERGELLRNDDWGERPLSYPIARRTSAEYHLFQFHAGSPELLAGLDRSLRIADEVLRFRIIKLAPGVPEAPDMSAAPAPARRSESEPEPARAREPDTDAKADPPPETPPEVAVGEAS